MFFSLIFIFVLSIIVTLGTYLLLKSDLSPIERYLSAFIILFLYSSITILNEYKQSPLDSPLIQKDFLYEVFHEEEMKNLEKRAFSNSQNTLKNHYKLPILHQYRPFLTQILNVSVEKFFEKTPFFYWVESPKDIGVSFALREFVRDLKREIVDLPILYVDLLNLHGFFKRDLHSCFKVSSLELFMKILMKINRKFDQIPILIIDSIDKSFDSPKEFQQEFTKDLTKGITKEFPKYFTKDFINDVEIFMKKREVSNVFEELLWLFKRVDLRVFVINYDRRLDLQIELAHFIERKRVFNEEIDWEGYLTGILNEFIDEKEKKFNKENVGKWKEMIEIDLAIIDEYYKNLKSFKSPQGFLFTN